MKELIPVPFVDLKAQYSSIKTEIDEAILSVLEDCNFVLGDCLEKFEESFASFLGCRYAIGVSNGLDALRLSLKALNIGTGDEVIIPANTYVATALAVSSVNARPVLVDIDPENYNMDPDLIEGAITGSTRAIIPVHLYGQPADMQPILDIANRHNLFVIEDACQSHGARYRGRRTGTLGNLGCFSFYPAKNLGAYGDGGAVVTGDQQLAEKIVRLRNYGQRARYDHVEKGFNARLDTIQAAVLTVKLKYLDAWNHSRASHAAYYNEHLQTIGDIQVPQVHPDRDHIYHLYVIRSGFRNQLQEFLNRRKITTLIHYPVPVQHQKAFADLAYRKGEFPHTEQAAGEILSLPMYAELQPEQKRAVADSISDFYQSQ